MRIGVDIGVCIHKIQIHITYDWVQQMRTTLSNIYIYVYTYNYQYRSSCLYMYIYIHVPYRDLVLVSVSLLFSIKKHLNISTTSYGF